MTNNPYFALCFIESSLYPLVVASVRTRPRLLDRKQTVGQSRIECDSGENKIHSKAVLNQPLDTKRQLNPVHRLVVREENRDCDVCQRVVFSMPCKKEGSRK